MPFPHTGSPTVVSGSFSRQRPRLLEVLVRDVRSWLVLQELHNSGAGNPETAAITHLPERSLQLHPPVESPDDRVHDSCVHWHHKVFGVQGTDIKAGARLTGVMLKVKYVAQFVGESAGSWAGGATSILHNSYWCTATHCVEVGNSNCAPRKVLTTNVIVLVCVCVWKCWNMCQNCTQSW